MKTSITIHPKFNFLKDYIEQVPQTFESLSSVLYRDRNLIKTDEVSNVKVVIKSYGRIYLTNRIRYSFFYPSKAERAYRNGLRLLEEGFLTPEPIAFIERSKGGLLTQSYFISLYTDFTPLASIISDGRRWFDQGFGWLCTSASSAWHLSYGLFQRQYFVQKTKRSFSIFARG